MQVYSLLPPCCQFRQQSLIILCCLLCLWCTLATAAGTAVGSKRDSRAERRRERRQRCHPLLSAPLIRWRMALTCTAVPRRAARWAPASRSAGFATVSAIPAGRRRVTQICNRLQTVAASNERQWRPPCCARLCKAGGHPKAH